MTGVSEGVVIPAGMVLWQGGQHRAPDDWDGQSVLFRSGEVRCAVPGVHWKLGWEHHYGDGDVIAYTPKTPCLAALADQRDERGGVGLREVLKASLAKRSVSTMDPLYTAAFNAALDMVAQDTAAALAASSAPECGVPSREPTQGMLEAGNAMFHAGEVPLNIWRAMYDAALLAARPSLSGDR